ncbi:hypothetical protein [Bacillus kexueae]|uniref:hypothetical protein n=1 Tax=Aeribacillus kexueae TaxID=2078952 RepID=UPI001FAF2081|nr:hypothetical protein [Bacillus kexueae]
MNVHEEYQDLILQYDMLDENEKRQVDDHIQTCQQCQQYFHLFVEMNEALDILAIEEDIDELKEQQIDNVTPLPKKRSQPIWKKFALAASLLIMVTVSFAFTEQGQAAIQKALNLLVAEKVLEGAKPLPEKEGKQVALYSKEKVNGIIMESYSIGDELRIEDEFGNYRIITPDTTYIYNKEENTFTIEQIEGGAEWESSFIAEKSNDNIQYLGTDEYFGREVEKYLIKHDEVYSDEYWFDKEYNQIIRVIEFHSGIREERAETLELKEITIDKDSELFDTSPPEGAEVIDLRNQESDGP